MSHKVPTWAQQKRSERARARAQKLRAAVVEEALEFWHRAIEKEEANTIDFHRSLSEPFERACAALSKFEVRETKSDRELDSVAFRKLKT